MKRIVVLLKHGIGDHIMAIPLLKMCKNNVQDGDKIFVYVGSQSARIIVENAISIDKSVEIKCIGETWATSKLSVLRLGVQLRMLRPTLLLIPHSTNRLRTTLFAFIVGSQITVLPYSKINSLFYRTVHTKMGEHNIHNYLNFGLTGGLKNSGELSMFFNVSEFYVTGAKKKLLNWKPDQKWIGFSPGSGVVEAHKRWPISSYITLGKMILDKGSEFHLVIFGGPTETSLVNEIKNGLHGFDERIVTVIDPDIMVPAAVLKYCDCLVSACSGLTHLAAAVETPVVALYGPTNPGFTGPFSKKVRIVRVGLKCSPCYRIKFNRGCATPLCMSMITPAVVDDEIMKIIIKKEFNETIPWCATTNAVKPQL
jgi:heptosyltransferase-2